MSLRSLGVSLGSGFGRVLVLLLLMVWSTSAALGQAEAPALPESKAATIDPADYDAKRVVVVHYLRADGDYSGWNLWTWTGNTGGAFMFGEVLDRDGVTAVVPVRDDGAERLGFIVRKNDWEAKDIDRDRFVELPDEGVDEVWLVSGDPTVYLTPDKVDLEAKTVMAFLDAGDAVTLATTGRLSDAQASEVSVTASGGTELSVADVALKRDASGAGVAYTVRLAEPVADELIAKLTVSVPGLESLPVFARDVMNEERFTPLDAQLGAIHTEEATTFRTWSPVADAVELLLFETRDAAAPSRALALKRADKGLWEVTVDGDLHNVAYVYRLRSYGQSRIAADIHTFGATPDSLRSVVLDLDRTDPRGWGDTPNPLVEHKTDEVIYEVHVRDYTVADETAPERIRGKYLGMIHENSGDASFANGVSTGLTHMQELGISAVHLLPIHDFGNERHAYNWGYWTSLFNVPESGYATNEDDPELIAREFKQMVQGLHAAGIRVILDVVYNHTSSSREYSPFDQTVPYFYFRTNDDGSYRNDAGVGNSVADERAMVRKYILDSLKFWTNEYRVDGYRFDLLGTHQPETVRAIAEELRAIRPDLTLYGEPWTGGGPTYFPKGAQRDLPFAVFNDDIRNAIRGDLDGTAQGFASGPGGDHIAIQQGVAGAVHTFANEPIESVVYASAHDNLTLWDKLLKANPDASEAELRAMQKLALGIVLTSQGVSFLHGGSDFARTKDGEHNSYNLGDEINQFDWPRKAEYRDVFNYVAGLVKLRRAHPAFRMHDDALVKAHLRFDTVEPGFVSYEMDGAAVGDAWSRLFVAYNGQPAPRRLSLPRVSGGDWRYAVDHAYAGPRADRAASGRVTLPPYSMAVFYVE
ncbi:MAG: type I pullulanase [Planctomycetota bacterium]